MSVLAATGRLWTAGALLAAGVLGTHVWKLYTDRGRRLPATVLWAWERPEDLRFLDPRQAGVAYLAGTVTLRAGGVEVRPRLQPLHLPPGTKLLAVVRLESSRTEPPELSIEQRRQTAEAILHLTGRDGVLGTQIDFDAAVSERDFYRALLRELRDRLPKGRMLTMTALASWCLEDDWIGALPVDEAVPMLFRMGADDGEVRARLRRGEDFRERLCRGSFGISTDEARPRLRYGRRIYVFHPRSWTETAARNILKETQAWR